MKKSICILFVVCLIFSCKKKSESSNPQSCIISATTIAGTYKKTAIAYKATLSTSSVDEFSSIPDCEKDNTYILQNDGRFVKSDEGINCGLPPIPGAEAWDLLNGNTDITLGTETYKIVSFDCTNLVVSQANASVFGDLRTITYVKQ